MREPINSIELSSKLFAVVLLAACFAATAFAQSIDADSPTPVSASEVSGRIAARDIGDARLTRYFYIFSAAPGDLLVTVESSNLNGDVDLFTAGTLRPLAKVSMYAAESETKATKSIFLKQRQQIVLRVEARSANDNDGVYRLRFEGSFEALPDSALASGTTPATPRAPEVSSTRSSGTKRVSATGARLPEEVKEAEESKSAQPQPSPSPTVAETTATTTTPEPVTTARRTPRVPRKSTRTPPPANTASAQPARNRTPRARSANKPAPASSATAATASVAKSVPQPTTERPASATVAASPRLVIEFRSGAKTERSMSSVRRVTIDNNQLVIVNRDGKIERQQLADVLRFSIEP
ncbi:MAG: hypothetical protein ACR2LC_06415 [Pyrinomonadaceae bacterium]